MADNINVKKLFEKYKTFINTNPDIATQIESAVRLLSYFVAGRFDSSPILSELIYSAANLLVLFNDCIIRQAVKIKSTVHNYQQQVKTVLTILEYTDVFAELTARHALGESGHWLVVIIIQIIKTVLRCLLLFHYKDGIQPNPPIPPGNRDIEAVVSPLETVVKTAKENGHVENMFSENGSNKHIKVAFTLRRSGKRMRTLEAAPPLYCRTWKVPDEPLKKSFANIPLIHITTELNKEQIIAETLYILRPLIHLGGLYLFGKQSWKPWLVSCGLDVSSLYLLGDPKKLSSIEQSEFKRRQLLLLHYILRSPFYDKYSKRSILTILRGVSDHIPGMAFIIGPLIEYLPVWQQIYFYNWST